MILELQDSEGRPAAIHADYVEVIQGFVPTDMVPTGANCFILLRSGRQLLIRQSYYKVVELWAQAMVTMVGK